MTTTALRISLGGVAAALVLALASAAHADIVYDRGQSQITVAADDGSGSRTLVTAAQIPNIKGVFAPAVSPSGTTVVFEGEDPTFDPRGVSDCGSDCVGVYQDVGGTVSRVSGSAPPCSDPCELMESQPEIGPTGKIISQYVWATWVSFTGPDGIPVWSIDPSHSWTGLTTPPHGDPVDGPSPNEIPTVCSGHDVSQQPAYPSISPDGARLVYVNCEDTSTGQTLYAETVANADGGSATSCAADDAPIADPSFSLDGSRIVDAEGGDQPGLWSYASSCPDAAAFDAGIRHVLSTPTGTVVQSPRYVGGDRIDFVAVQGQGTDQQTGDVWSIPTSCGAAGTPCSFPADATQLTHDGDVSNVAWTAGQIAPPTQPTPSGSATGGTTPGGSTAGATGPAPAAPPTQATPPAQTPASGIATPPPSSPSPIAAPHAMITAVAAGHLRALRHGLALRLTCTHACRGTVHLAVDPATARALHLKGLALGSARFSGHAGKVTVHVRIPARLRVRLARWRTLRLHLAVVPTGARRQTFTVVARR